MMAKQTKIPVAMLELDDSDIKRLPARLEKKAERAVKRVGLLIEGAAVRNAPVARFRNKRKGTNLANSGTTEFSGRGFQTQAKIKFTASYAIFVHEGTGIFGPEGRPYEIFPKNKQALFWPGAPHPVKKVIIRGMKGRPFLKKAFEEKGPRLRELIFK